MLIQCTYVRLVRLGWLMTMVFLQLTMCSEVMKNLCEFFIRRILNLAYKINHDGADANLKRWINMNQNFQIVIEIISFTMSVCQPMSLL